MVLWIWKFLCSVKQCELSTIIGACIAVTFIDFQSKQICKVLLSCKKEKYNYLLWKDVFLWFGYFSLSPFCAVEIEELWIDILSIKLEFFIFSCTNTCYFVSLEIRKGFLTIWFFYIGWQIALLCLTALLRSSKFHLIDYYIFSYMMSIIIILFFYVLYECVCSNMSHIRGFSISSYYLSTQALKMFSSLEIISLGTIAF